MSNQPKKNISLEEDQCCKPDNKNKNLFPMSVKNNTSGSSCSCCAPDTETKTASQQSASQQSGPLQFPQIPLNTVKEFPLNTAKQPSLNTVKSVLAVGGLDCADCAAKLEKRILGLNGVLKANLNFATAKLTIEHSNSVDAILKAITDSGYSATLEGRQKTDGQSSFWVKNKRSVLTVISAFFFAISFLLSLFGVNERILVPLDILAMIVGGYYIGKAGYYSVKALTFDMNFLMTVAAVGAGIIGQWSEAAAVVVLFSLGNTLQAYTMDKTRRSIRGLMDLSPKEALVRRDGREVTMPVEEIKLKDVIIVKPGERIAMDGVVIQGTSSVNQAPITGESMPVDKKTGDEVYAGTINERGALEIEVTKLVEDTTLAKIIHLVEEAQSQKAPSQQFVDVFAKYYTPIVMLVAVGIAVIPPLIFGQLFSPWFYKALILLVVACPCALVISTPVSIVSAIGNAAKHGVLIKGGAHLEEAGKLQALAFDKTGTLTNGHPDVTDVIEIDAEEQEILSIAAAIEQRSQHPLAEAITKYATKNGIPVSEETDFESITGKGAKATIKGQKYFIGNSRLFSEMGIGLDKFEQILKELQAKGRTVMLLGTEEKILGLIAVADKLRENSLQAVNGLKEAGISQVVMLTGDNRRTAQAIAGELGITDTRAELLPQDKLDAVKGLLEDYGKVGMVGDGINDAPALATATIGIAMGGACTDTALETADIVLMADDLSKLPFAMRLSRKALGIIKQNIWFALVVKAVFILLTFLGISNLWLAVIADTGAALVVIANGMRLMWVKPAM